MSAWSFACEPVLGGRGARHRLRHGADRIGYGQALELLESSAAFRAFLSRTIAASPYTALRWETPPVTRDSLAREFEFVLVDDPFLAMAPEPHVFGPWFDDVPAEVLALAVPNLGRTARLVVPRAVVDAEAYVHLKEFVRRAPEDQVHRLWECVARTIAEELLHGRAQAALPPPSEGVELPGGAGSTQDRLWVSTAGGGVSWLHVRIERVPKYYSYRPYANDLALP